MIICFTCVLSLSLSSSFVNCHCLLGGRDAEDVAIEDSNEGEQMAGRGYGATFKCGVRENKYQWLKTIDKSKWQKQMKKNKWQRNNIKTFSKFFLQLMRLKG